MKQQVKPIARQDELVIQELKGEVLIYDLKINKAFCLNETSALVYQLCDGNNSISDISGQLSKKLKSPVTEDFIWLAIEQLKRDNLLANREEIVTDFGGMNRREVIRKVGLATMVALPLISSLVAPTAAMAQSAGDCRELVNGDCYAFLESGFECGILSNACSVIQCGSCTSPETCGGGGTPNVCGCTVDPTICNNSPCGSITNNCGTTTICPCPSGQVCNPSGVCVDESDK